MLTEMRTEASTRNQTSDGNDAFWSHSLLRLGPWQVSRAPPLQLSLNHLGAPAPISLSPRSDSSPFRHWLTADWEFRLTVSLGTVNQSHLLTHWGTFQELERRCGLSADPAPSQSVELATYRFLEVGPGTVCPKPTEDQRKPQKLPLSPAEGCFRLLVCPSAFFIILINCQGHLLSTVKLCKWLRLVLLLLRGTWLQNCFDYSSIKSCRFCTGGPCSQPHPTPFESWLGALLAGWCAEK